MISRRRLLILGMCLLAAMFVPGCDIFRRARRVPVQPPPPFQSPFTEFVGRPGMSLPEITEILGERQADTRSILGTLSVIVGQSRSRTRLQFDANMYFAPPEFLRVRGSADAGTLFDFLMEGNNVQVMLTPEKKIHSGTLAQLRQNPDLMAGLQPDDLMYSFLVDKNLYLNLTTKPGATIQQTPTHYIITVIYPSGLSENYHLRMGDLLVDRIERYNGRRAMGSVRFDGYGFFQAENSEISHLLPTRFEAQSTDGNLVIVEARTLQPNAPRNEELGIINIPPDFQQLPL